jgi:hypothetical protein
MTTRDQYTKKVTSLEVATACDFDLPAITLVQARQAGRSEKSYQYNMLKTQDFSFQSK